VPTNLIGGRNRFRFSSRACPGKVAAARGLPLGPRRPRVMLALDQPDALAERTANLRGAHHAHGDGRLFICAPSANPVSKAFFRRTPLHRSWKTAGDGALAAQGIDGDRGPAWQ